MRRLLSAAPVVHADETFARAAGSTSFVHVACTEFLSLFHAVPGSQVWAKAMADTLLHAHHLAETARVQRQSTLAPEDLEAIRNRYAGALALARTENPDTNTSILAHDARTLARRFIGHQDLILRFASDLRVPFTNNEVERPVRVVKVEQRSSGGTWRTLQGLADFAVVQSYLSTARTWGLIRWQALRQLFTTGPWIPPALTPAAA